MDETKIKVNVEYLTVRDLQKAIKAAKDEMVGLKEGSAEFKQAAKNAGELLHLMQAIQLAVRGASSDFGDMVGNVAKAGAGITGAFQAAQGAMKLFGSESEDVTKAIQKMQSVMALTQGLQAIDQGIKAFGKFTTAVSMGSSKIKKALITTGFGALAIVIGSLIANWDEFTKSIGLSEKQMQKFGNVAFGVINTITGSIKTISKAIARALGGDFKGALNVFTEEFSIKKFYNEGIAKHEAEVLKKIYEAAKKSGLESAKAWTDAFYEELEKADFETKVYNKLLSLMGEPGKKDKPTILRKIIGSIEDEEENLQNIEERLKAINFAKAIIGDETTFYEDLQNQQAALDEYYQKGIISEETYNKASNKLAKQRTAYHMQAAAQAMQGVASIFSSLAQMEDGQSKESFEKQKKLQVAGATMSMLSGITAAISGLFTTKSGPWDIALGVIQAAAIAASGIANIAQIKKQKFDGGASSGAASANLSNIARTANTPVQMTQDIQGAETIGAIKDSKVYVTETDITNTQKKVDIAETESRF